MKKKTIILFIDLCIYFKSIKFFLLTIVLTSIIITYYIVHVDKVIICYSERFNISIENGDHIVYFGVTYKLR